jgi:hypothetical protein
MPSEFPESGSQPAAGIARAVGRVPLAERVEANGFALAAAERTVKLVSAQVSYPVER